MSGHRPPRTIKTFIFVLIVSVLCTAGTVNVLAQDSTVQANPPIGRDATPAEITDWDIDIEPDGTGLPAGSGTVASGREVYDAKCLMCHGPTGGENPGDTGITPNLANFYCCATTLYDYINRAMPYFAAQSLKPEEIYSLVALLLHLNKIVPENFVANAKTVPAVTMPAAAHYSVNPWTSGIIEQPGDPWSHD